MSVVENNKNVSDGEEQLSDCPASSNPELPHQNSIISKDQHKNANKNDEHELTTVSSGHQSKRGGTPKMATSATKKLSAAVKAFLSSAAARNTKRKDVSKSQKDSTQKLLTAETSTNNETKVKHRNPLLTSLMQSSHIPVGSAIKIPPSASKTTSSNTTKSSNTLSSSPASCVVNQSMTTPSITKMPTSSVSINPSVTTASKMPTLSDSVNPSMTTAPTAKMPSLSASLNQSMTTASTAKMPTLSASINPPMTAISTSKTPTLSASLNQSMTILSSTEVTTLSASVNPSITTASTARMPHLSPSVNPPVPFAVPNTMSTKMPSAVGVSPAPVDTTTNETSNDDLQQTDLRTSKQHLLLANQERGTKDTDESSMLKSNDSVPRPATMVSSSTSKTSETLTAAGGQSAVGGQAHGNDKQPVMTLYLKKTSRGQLILTQAVPHVKCSTGVDTKQSSIKVLTGGNVIPLHIGGSLGNIPMKANNQATPSQILASNTSTRHPGATQPARYPYSIPVTNMITSPSTSSSQMLSQTFIRAPIMSSTRFGPDRVKGLPQGQVSVGQHIVHSSSATPWAQVPSHLNTACARSVRHTVPAFLGSPLPPPAPVQGIVQQGAYRSTTNSTGLPQNQIEACKIWSRRTRPFFIKAEPNASETDILMNQAICWTKMSLQQKVPFIEEAQRLQNQTMMRQHVKIPRPLQWNGPVTVNPLMASLVRLPNAPVNANAPVRYFMSPSSNRANTKAASVVSTANGVFQLHNIVTTGSHPARITMQWKPVTSQRQQLMNINTTPHTPPANLISIPDRNVAQTMPVSPTTSMPNPTLVKMMRGASYVAEHPERFISDRFIRKTMSDDVYDVDDLLEDAERGVHWRGRGPDIVPNWLVNFVAEYDSRQKVDNGNVNRPTVSSRGANSVPTTGTPSKDKPTSTNVLKGDKQKNQSPVPMVPETGNHQQGTETKNASALENRENATVDQVVKDDSAKQTESDPKSGVSVGESHGGDCYATVVKDRPSTDKDKKKPENKLDDTRCQHNSSTPGSVGQSDLDYSVSSKVFNDYSNAPNFTDITGDDLNDLGDIDLIADNVMWNLCIRLFPNTRRVRLWRDNTEELERFLDKISVESSPADKQTESVTTTDAGVKIDVPTDLKTPGVLAPKEELIATPEPTNDNTEKVASNNDISDSGPNVSDDKQTNITDAGDKEHRVEDQGDSERSPDIKAHPENKTDIRNTESVEPTSDIKEQNMCTNKLDQSATTDMKDNEVGVQSTSDVQCNNSTATHVQDCDIKRKADNCRKLFKDTDPDAFHKQDGYRFMDDWELIDWSMEANSSNQKDNTLNIETQQEDDLIHVMNRSTTFPNPNSNFRNANSSHPKDNKLNIETQSDDDIIKYRSTTFPNPNSNVLNAPRPPSSRVQLPFPHTPGLSYVNYENIPSCSTDFTYGKPISMEKYEEECKPAKQKWKMRLAAPPRKKKAKAKTKSILKNLPAKDQYVPSAEKCCIKSVVEANTNDLVGDEQTSQGRKEVGTDDASQSGSVGSDDQTCSSTKTKPCDNGVIKTLQDTSLASALIKSEGIPKASNVCSSGESGPETADLTICSGSRTVVSQSNEFEGSSEQGLSFVNILGSTSGQKASTDRIEMAEPEKVQEAGDTIAPLITSPDKVNDVKRSSTKKTRQQPKRRRCSTGRKRKDKNNLTNPEPQSEIIRSDSPKTSKVGQPPLSSTYTTVKEEERVVAEETRCNDKETTQHKGNSDNARSVDNVENNMDNARCEKNAESGDKLQSTHEDNIKYAREEHVGSTKTHTIECESSEDIIKSERIGDIEKLGSEDSLVSAKGEEDNKTSVTNGVNIVSARSRDNTKSATDGDNGENSRNEDNAKSSRSGNNRKSTRNEDSPKPSTTSKVKTENDNKKSEENEESKRNEGNAENDENAERTKNGGNNEIARSEDNPKTSARREKNTKCLRKYARKEDNGTSKKHTLECARSEDNIISARPGDTEILKSEDNVLSAKAEEDTKTSVISGVNIVSARSRDNTKRDTAGDNGEDSKNEDDRRHRTRSEDSPKTNATSKVNYTKGNKQKSGENTKNEDNTESTKSEDNNKIARSEDNPKTSKQSENKTKSPMSESNKKQLRSKHNMTKSARTGDSGENSSNGDNAESTSSGIIRKSTRRNDSPKPITTSEVKTDNNHISKKIEDNKEKTTGNDDNTESTFSEGRNDIARSEDNPKASKRSEKNMRSQRSELKTRSLRSEQNVTGSEDSKEIAESEDNNARKEHCRIKRSRCSKSDDCDQIPEDTSKSTRVSLLAEGSPRKRSREDNLNLGGRKGRQRTRESEKAQDSPISTLDIEESRETTHASPIKQAVGQHDKEEATRRRSGSRKHTDVGRSSYSTRSTAQKTRRN